MEFIPIIMGTAIQGIDLMTKKKAMAFMIMLDKT